MSATFTKKWIDEQKEKLLLLKTEIMNRINEKGTEDLHVKQEDNMEDGDQAQTYLNQNLSVGLRERELYTLREIESALDRIENGSYGYCEELEEPIEIKRLEKIPYARLSIQAAESMERGTSAQKRFG